MAIHKSISKQLSLPVEYTDEQKSFYSSTGLLQTHSILDDDIESGLNIHDDDLHSCVSIHKSNITIERPNSYHSGSSSTSLTSCLRCLNSGQTVSSHTKAVDEINYDSEPQCSRNSVTSNISKLKYFDDTDTSNLFDNVQKDTFKDRLLYFPTISNQLLLTILLNIEKYDSTSAIDAKFSLPKKELKFAVPEFLMPIIDRRTSSQIFNVKQISASTLNIENKLLKRRKTIKERFKQLHSDYDGSKFWNKLNKNFKMNKVINLSNTRSRSSMAISMDYTHHKDSVSRSSITSCDDCRRITINVSGLNLKHG
ncbi:unnamed protein product [Schistosoma mattheei]|uniref:Uncharacterized protein n=1 Tax=Schistosoma mattheei TaxID=31246 RepID=A0AA85B7X5_9TREM|nr:unnamed protein product [Schistosoma mattheei]